MKDKTVVYRIECKNGEGPYVNGCMTNSSSTPERPVPEHDGIPDVRYFEYFAFTSPRQLDDWFGDEYDVLSFYSTARIRVYEVDKQHVRVGIRQCVFRKEEADCVQEVSIDQWVSMVRAGLLSASVTQTVAPRPTEQLSLDLGDDSACEASKEILKIFGL